MVNLPLPWKRSADTAAEDPPDASDRRPVRRRGGRNRRVGISDENAAAAARARRSVERRRQRIAFIIGGALILIIVAVVMAGVYQAYIHPPRVMAGEVRGVKFTMGDLVERIRVLQGIDRYQGGQVDLSTIPFQLLTDLLHVEILRQAAPGLQINVTDEQIEEAIRGRFRPEPQPGQEVDDAQLDAEYRNTYTGFLTQVNLDDAAYRRIVEEQLQQRELFARMLASLPEEAQQVELQAISISINSDAVPEAVKERLELGEDFATVAREISRNDGYIGWVPEGAFPDFDPYLFGETEVTESGETKRKPPLLSAGDVSEPIYVDQSIFLIRAIGAIETREIEPAMRFQMAGARVEEWKDDQLTQGTQEGWVKINFDSNRYAWVTEQVRLTRPRVTPEPQREQGGFPGGLTR
ncbi:MAG: SurA N-terminal domain-containing protein [Chloroflexota bacterium]|nr:SurA N-terminal domain-containing protein [Chloroflexota bacterium]MDE2684347.1 SurA N-terminal domain-containing protein [Chloroflexota bacterium]